MHLQGAPPWRVLARIVYASSHATRTLLHPHQPLFFPPRHATVPSSASRLCRSLRSPLCVSLSPVIRLAFPGHAQPAIAYSFSVHLFSSSSLSPCLSSCPHASVDVRAPLSRPTQRQQRAPVRRVSPFYFSTLDMCFHLPPASRCRRLSPSPPALSVFFFPFSRSSLSLSLRHPPFLSCPRLPLVLARPSSSCPFSHFYTRAKNPTLP